jgi:hypothetical protein
MDEEFVLNIRLFIFILLKTITRPLPMRASKTKPVLTRVSVAKRVSVLVSGVVFFHFHFYFFVKLRIKEKRPSVSGKPFQILQDFQFTTKRSTSLLSSLLLYGNLCCSCCN